MSVAATARPRGPRGVRHYLRVLQVIVLAEYKLKYAGSVLGYVWSVVKPLSLFTVLYVVFARILKLGSISPYYGLALLIGIVLFSFFSDASSQGMVALVHRESLLRRLRFPRLIIPTAATLTAAMTFAVNIAVVLGFVAWERITPRLDWLLLVPLVLELYLFTLGLALILTTLFVSLRDIGQVWELGVQLLFYACPIVYPVTLLPDWAQKLTFAFPVTQVVQDMRAIVLYDDTSGMTMTGSDLFGPWAQLIPLSVTALVLFGGLALFTRHEPWFAERT